MIFRSLPRSGSSWGACGGGQCFPAGPDGFPEETCDGVRDRLVSAQIVNAFGDHVKQSLIPFCNQLGPGLWECLVNFTLARDVPVVFLGGYESLFGTYGFVAQIALKSPDGRSDIVLGEIDR